MKKTKIKIVPIPLTTPSRAAGGLLVRRLAVGFGGGGPSKVPYHHPISIVPVPLGPSAHRAAEAKPSVRRASRPRADAERPPDAPTTAGEDRCPAKRHREPVWGSPSP